MKKLFFVLCLIGLLSGCAVVDPYGRTSFVVPQVDIMAPPLAIAPPLIVPPPIVVGPRWGGWHHGWGGWHHGWRHRW